MTTLVEVTCDFCAAAFSRPLTLHNSNRKRGRLGCYCSPKCRDGAKAKEKVSFACDQCGAVVERNARTVRRLRELGGHFFCSRTCAWESPLRRGIMGARRANLKPMPEIRMTDFEIGYLAGIVDGEGSIGMSPLRRRQINVALCVSNTDRRILAFCQAATGIGRVIEQPSRRDPKHRVQYIWSIAARNELRAVLPLLIPALVSKKGQAIALLEYCERRAEGGPTSDRELELCGIVKRLNARDKPVAA